MRWYYTCPLEINSYCGGKENHKTFIVFTSTTMWFRYLTRFFLSCSLSLSLLPVIISPPWHTTGALIDSAEAVESSTQHAHPYALRVQLTTETLSFLFSRMKLIIDIHTLRNGGTDIISTNRQWCITYLWALIKLLRPNLFFSVLCWSII